jgi:formylglycine-generating enzyme required for sulfatase activity
MSSFYDPAHPPASTPVPHAHIRCAPGVRLSSDQLDLLAQAFSDIDVIFVKQEFRSGYSGALVLLVSLGAHRAPVVVKLAHPLDLEREYQAYQQFVRQISPQNISHLHGPPLLSADQQLGLVQYSYAGGESHQAATSLRDYYEANGGSASAAILNRIFRAYGRYWWANNRPHLYTLSEQYDRLLPVHLQVAIAPAENEPVRILEPGKTSVLTLREISIGQQIRLINFQVTKVQATGKKMTLVAPPPPNEASAPVRIRLELDETLHPLLSYRPGDYVERLDAIVVATRESLLSDAATEALPNFAASQEIFAVGNRSLPTELSGIVLINPLYDLAGLLDRVVETKASIIHGDLNLQNILVDTPTGFAWIIDFGETRYGPTLLDLQRLEVQVITKLLPTAMQQAQLQPFAIVEQIIALHADPLPSAPQLVALQEPFHVLVTTRRLARQYLIDDLDWDEYYLGLVITLIGALKYDELDAFARSLALIAAATARGLIGQRLHPGHHLTLSAVPAVTGTDAVTPDGSTSQPLIATATPVPVRSSRAGSRSHFIGIGAGILVALVALLISWRLWLMPMLFNEPVGTPTSVAALAAIPGQIDMDATAVSALAVATTGVPPATAEVVAASTSDVSSTVTSDITSTARTGAIENNPMESSDGNGNVSDADNSETARSAIAGASTPMVSSATTTVQSLALTPTPTLPVETTTPQPTEANTSQVASSSPPPASSAGSLWSHPVDSATYVFVPEGEFTMGSEDSRTDAQPPHTVFLSDYWIMQTEVTNSQYKLCVEAGVCTPPANDRWNDSIYADHPVTQVTWQQAYEYARWIGGRLPTEAEWEKAARGVDGRIYPWGNELQGETLLNYNFSTGDTVPVGSYPAGASVYGVLDMAGNVEEWVADWYAPDYYASAPTQDPSGPEEGVLRVLRGGSYFSNRQAILATSREKALPDTHFDSVGFRVSISP